jgi:hypothetical protein
VSLPVTVADSKCVTPGGPGTQADSKVFSDDTRESARVRVVELGTSEPALVPVALMSLGFFAGVYTRPGFPRQARRPPGATPGDSESDSPAFKFPADSRNREHRVPVCDSQ